MTRVSFLTLLSAIVVLVLAQPAASAPPPAPPDPSCSPSPSDCGAWHHNDVTVTWDGPPAGVSASGCGTTTIYNDTSGTPISCTWSNGDGSRTTTTNVRKDGGQPSISAHPDRGPDINGWYNHPLQVVFTGSDSLSGIATCTTAGYSGPDSRHAVIGGSCTDNAGNINSTRYEFKYDATPPSVEWVKAEPGGRGLLLIWGASKDSVRFDVVRQPGLQGTTPSTIYRGDSRSFTDHRVRHGVKYRYAITAYDGAGNAKVKILLAEPGRPAIVGSPSTAKRKSTPAQPTLLAPTEGARVSRPPTLRWRTAPRATYYNVQLYHNGRKVLSTWPSKPRLRLKRTWTYAGHRYALAPGRYRWYVWPGLGARSASRYGKLIGMRSFVVAR